MPQRALCREISLGAEVTVLGLLEVPLDVLVTNFSGREHDENASVHEQGGGDVPRE